MSSKTPWFENPFLLPQGGVLENPLDEIVVALNMYPSFVVLGDSEIDLIDGVTLAAVGTTPALDDQPTVALIENDSSFPLVTAAYEFSATNDAWQAPDNTVNDVGTGSALIVVTFKLDTVPATRALVSKRRTTASNDGYEIKITSDQKAQCTAQVVGQAAVTAELIGPFAVDQWHTVCVLFDRSTNQLVIGSTDEAPLESGNEASMALPTGTLVNDSTWAIGAQRLQAIDGQVLHVVYFEGAQVEGKSPKLVAREIAKRSWWDEARGRIIP